MRALRLAVAIVCSLISSATFSEDVGLGKTIVKVSPPTGFCELDKTSKADIAYFNALSDYVKVGGFSLIALYPECRELAEARKSSAFIATKVAIANWDKRADRPPSQFISEACDVHRQGISGDQKARISQYVTQFSKGRSSVQNILDLGVLDEVKGTVCYSGQLGKVKIANAGEFTLVFISAGTSVGDQPITISQWTNYVDATSIATALANLKIIYSDFAAANGKSP